MRVALGTVYVGKTIRKAIAMHYGSDGMATREQVKRFMLTGAESRVDQAINAYYIENRGQ